MDREVKLLFTVIGLLLLTSSIYSVHVYTAVEKECPEQINDFMLYSYKVPWGVADRALRTAPPWVSVRPSTIAGLGVFAETFIKAHTWLGEYEGVSVPAKFWHDVTLDDTYMYRVYRRSRTHHYTDAVDTNAASWTRFINGASHPRLQNVASNQCFDKVYFRLTKDVAPGAELLVYYGRDYSQRIGIDVSPFLNKSVKY